MEGFVCNLKTYRQAKGLTQGELAELVMTQHLARHQVEKEELCSRYPDYFVLPQEEQKK